MRLKKFYGTIKVVLEAPRVVEDSTSREKEYLVGYYQCVSVFAPTEGDAIAIFNNAIQDGRVNWGESELVRIKPRRMDWLKMFLGTRVVYESGKALFPSDATARDDDESIVGWRL